MPEQQKIYSRFYFDTFVTKELSRSRLTGRPVSLMLIEPKFLFSPNKKDEQQLEPLLACITQVIKEQIRSSDLLCRYQRHRLAILLPETPPEHSHELLKRILTKLEERFANHAIIWFSAIIAPTGSSQISAQGLIQQAQSQLSQTSPPSTL